MYYKTGSEENLSLFNKRFGLVIRHRKKIAVWRYKSWEKIYIMIKPLDIWGVRKTAVGKQKLKWNRWGGTRNCMTNKGIRMERKLHFPPRILPHRQDFDSLPAISCLFLPYFFSFPSFIRLSLSLFSSSLFHLRLSFFSSAHVLSHAVGHFLHCFICSSSYLSSFVFFILISHLLPSSYNFRHAQATICLQTYQAEEILCWIIFNHDLKLQYFDYSHKR